VLQRHGAACDPSSEWVGGVVCSSANGRGGTWNFCVYDAITFDEVNRCIQIGCTETDTFVDKVRANIVIFGEVGIGNTTTVTALIAVLYGVNNVG
jgi:NaMN:DMB phosphoribosyltransferase